MKLSGRPKWKLIAVALLCSVSMLLLISGSYAAYTRQAYQRGIARNRDTETVSFTSNYLQLCTSGTKENSYIQKNVVFGEDEVTKDSVSFDIYVYNYANGNTSLVSQKDITYTMKIEFKDGSGTNYSVKCDDDEAVTVTGNVYEITKTLTGRVANANKFTVSFPGSEIDKMKITASAIPEDITITNNQFLATILVPCTSTAASTFRAEGTFIDKSEGTPRDYDGFNYEVSISGGQAEATLIWDSNIVEIDKYFLKKIGKQKSDINTEKDSGKQTLVFTMNQSAGTGDYLIPFYIKSKTAIPETWDEMKKVIQFSATQQTE